MAQSKSQRRVMRNHMRYRGRHDINVVPMIDMMVILVFFLIFSAVFTRTSILELNLPAANAVVPDLPQGLQLEVVVRKDRIDVADRGTGLLKSFPSLQPARYDFVALSEYLQLVKSKYPDKTDASILLEEDIAYDILVQTMDSVRLFQTPGKSYNYGELFPDVSVGDAPI
ncbi:MAG: biopolymer transporter ExbD [Candidatus Obscuribacterales bacterium]|nr:biopolymer transporter ExbD [Steroidobacteraceae bacterium]